MKIWIDLSNSPHPLLFAPVARRLEEEGHEVLVTARDNAQTLAAGAGAVAAGRGDRRGEPAAEDCRRRRRSRRRVADLRRWAARTRPTSRFRTTPTRRSSAARSLRIPAVTAMDFEHQPANHLAFRLARTDPRTRSMLRWKRLRRQGATPRKVVRYPGLKEELYIGDFEPDREILSKVGSSPRPRDRGRAAHPSDPRRLSPVVEPAVRSDALRTVCVAAGVVCVVLTRHPEQIAAIEGLGLGNCVVPRAAIDSRSLMYAADVMIGAGGTMTREAARDGDPDVDDVRRRRRPRWTVAGGARGCCGASTAPRNWPASPRGGASRRLRTNCAKAILGCGAGDGPRNARSGPKRGGRAPRCRVQRACRAGRSKVTRRWPCSPSAAQPIATVHAILARVVGVLCIRNARWSSWAASGSCARP